MNFICKTSKSREPKNRRRYNRLYNTWCNIKSRCNNSKNPRFSSYGGRGIKVCDEWGFSFSNFEKWAISNGYNNSLTIDRIDVNGNYEPSNCRWVTNSEQQLNKRTNRIIRHNGVSKTLKEWSDQTGLNAKTLQGRIDNSGWSVDRAIESPVMSKILNLTGQRFGRLTVVSIAHTKKGSHWNCICDCGVEKVIKGCSLTGGYTKSCGCLQREKVSILSKTREHIKPVLQYDLSGNFIKEYVNPIQAGRMTGISKGNIISVANGKEYKPGKTRKTAGGYVWKYKK